MSWNFTTGITASCRRVGCLEISTRAAAPQSQKDKQEKGNTLNLFNVFPENDDDDIHLLFNTTLTSQNNEPTKFQVKKRTQGFLLLLLLQGYLGVAIP